MKKFSKILLWFFATIGFLSIVFSFYMIPVVKPISTMLDLNFWNYSVIEGRSGWHRINVNDYFTIDTPIDFKYHQFAVDQRVGYIENEEIQLFFGFGNEASFLIETKNDYLNSNSWLWDAKTKIEKSKGIGFQPNPIEENYTVIDLNPVTELSSIYDYEATISYKDSIFQYQFVIPKEVKNHYCELDTINNIERKIILSRIENEGVTGGIFVDLSSCESNDEYYWCSKRLSVSVYYLNLKQQELVKEILKSIIILK